MINLIDRIRFWFEDKREFYQEKQLKKKYPDWNYENWIGDLEFIWGVKSYDDLTGCDANIHTMNDIEIDYDYKDRKYVLSIETAYVFGNKHDECEYLKGLLMCFEKYMDENELDKDIPYRLFFSQPCILPEARTIEDLYTHFALFVKGYIALYEEKENKI